MYVTFVSFWVRWWTNGDRRKQEIRRNKGGIEEGSGRKYAAGASSLVLLNDYFEGAGYSSGGAHIFAQGAPASAPLARFLLDNSDDILNQDYGTTRAHADTQPTAVTLFLVYFRHFSQHSLPPYTYSLGSKLTICL